MVNTELYLTDNFDMADKFMSEAEAKRFFDKNIAHLTRCGAYIVDARVAYRDKIYYSLKGVMII